MVHGGKTDTLLTEPHLNKARLPDWLHRPHIKSDRLHFYQSIYRPEQSQLQEEPVTEHRRRQNFRTMFRGAENK